MKRTEMYMPEDMLNDLNELGMENDVSRAQIVRSLVDYGLEHQDKIDFSEEEEEPEEDEEKEEPEDLEDDEDDEDEDEPEEEEEED